MEAIKKMKMSKKRLFPELMTSCRKNCLQEKMAAVEREKKTQNNENKTNNIPNTITRYNMMKKKDKKR